jgi:hypothetical protein
MVKVSCFTNLESHQNEIWPDEFVGMPVKGDWVESKKGKVLKVVAITHCFWCPQEDWRIEEYSNKRVAYLKVELNH